MYLTQQLSQLSTLQEQYDIINSLKLYRQSSITTFPKQRPPILYNMIKEGVSLKQLMLYSVAFSLLVG